jgi:hypothetical protein
MACWEALPPEIRVLILENFCEELIDEFEDLPQALVGIVPPEYFDREYHPDEWPPGPAVLEDFMAALTTCREFYHIITNTIKFDGLSPRELLMRQQRDNLVAILDSFESPELKDILLSSPFLHELAGRFWANPEVIKDRHLIPRMLERTSVGSTRLWAPHIRPWLNEHAKTTNWSNSLYEFAPTEEVDCDNSYAEERKLLVLRRGSKLITFGDLPQWTLGLGGEISDGRTRWSTFTHMGRVPEYDWSERPSLAERELGENGGDEWWVMRSISKGSIYWPSEWILISFEEKRMYDGNLSSYWEWDDPWDTGSWRIVYDEEEPG